MESKLLKIGLLLIAAVMLVSIAFAGAASADYTLKGSGTEEDPYQISTALDLYNMSQNTSYFQGGTETKHFKLMKDISIANITSVESNYDAKTVTIQASGKPSQVYSWNDNTFTQPDWNPGFDESVVAAGITSLTTWPTIGTSNNPVTAKISFDGDGHTISGLFINASVANQGLFGYVKAAEVVNITNLTLRDSFVYSSNKYVGGLVGYNTGSALNIVHCSVADSAVIATGYLGGMVGSGGGPSVSNYCTIENSTILGFSTIGKTGGFAGYFSPQSGSMIANYTVKHCIITAKFSEVGGIIGYAKSGSIIRDCNVIGYTTIELIPSTTSTSCGGIVGSIGNPNILRCNVTDCKISTTTVSNVGGVVGGDSGSTLESIKECNVVNCTITSSSGNNVGGIGGDVKSTIDTCNVVNCTITSSSGNSVGGILGRMGASSIIKSTVIDCEKISGSDYVGGLVGDRNQMNQLTSTGNTVKNSTIYTTATLGSGGLVGRKYTKGTDSLTNNMMDNVSIISTGTTDKVSLFDLSNYNIHSANGIARLAEINLPDDNRIINSCVLVDDKANAQENTVLEGFTDVKDKLVSINVSNPKVTSIAKDAFKQSSLEEITGLDSITSVGDSAFEECSNLVSIDVKNAKTIGKNAFKKSGLKAICLRNVETIGDSAFENCSSLMETVVSYYGDLASYVSPQKISFPKTLKTIGDRAFYGCSLFGAIPTGYGSNYYFPIEIPEGTTSIGNEAFYNCTNICSITVPSTVTYVGTDVFGNRSDEKSGIYASADMKGIIYDNTGKIITDKTFNDDKNIAAVLVNKTTLEYKFLHNGDLKEGNYKLKNAYDNAPSVNPNAKNISAPNFMGWSTKAGNYSDETKAVDTTQLIYNDTGKYYYLYQVWDDETIYTLQQIYDGEGNPIAGLYLDRSEPLGIISYEDGYDYKLALKYGVKQIPLVGDERESGYTYQYHLWALKYNATSDKLEKVVDLIKPGTDRYLKPNVVVTYEDGTVVRYTDSQGRYVYNGSDPFFGSLYSDYAIEEIQTPIPPYTPSHRETGYTVILPENTTATPTPTPIGESTIKPTSKPTATQTQKSPAPFVGIIAGLGAAALLIRMRR